MKKLILFAILLIACDSTTDSKNEEENRNLNLISEKSSESLRVQIFSEKDSIKVGFNTLYIKVLDQNFNAITSRKLHTHPMMDMGTMMHTAPHEEASENADEDGYYKSSTSFIMTGMWMYTVQSIEGADTNEVIFTLDVGASSNVKNVSGTDDARYFITLINPEKMNVGMNDIEFLVNKRESMMSFPAIENYSLEIEPTMPSMGHGSPNNVNPSHVKNGHYMGKVNYTMSGEWQINLIMKNGESEVVNTNFMITL